VKRVLETNIVLYLLGGRLAQPLDPGEYYLSVITEMELLSYAGLSGKGEQQVREFLSSVTVVDLTTEVKEAAIRLRREHKLKLPDAIVAATADVLDAELLTNDQHLLDMPDLRTLSLPLA